MADLNVRIARRHVHSVALSRFFRERLQANSEAWRTVEGFFLRTRDNTRDDARDQSPTAAHLFRAYLAERDDKLREELRETFPRELHGPLGIEDWSWVEELVREDTDEAREAGLLPGPLSVAEANVRADEETYQTLIQEVMREQEQGKAVGKRADHYRHILNTLRSRYLLGYLASYTVLPKYGFPVDIVPLHTAHLEGGNRIELERDLRIAVAEFAPGSGVVAAGELWVSVGARRFPARALPEEQYAVCKRCRRFYPRSGRGTCSQCGGSARAGIMVLPLYGFVARQPTKRGLGDERPPRLWASEVYFFEHIANPEPFSTLFARGRETVSGRFSRNGWLAVVNTGSEGKGFSYCAKCGHAWPNGARAGGRGGTARGGHSRPGSHLKCGGQMVTVHFGHKFATDMAEFVHSGLTGAKEAEIRSVQAALEEAAARVLKVPRGELGSLFYYDGLSPVIVLYDNVPGGAGLARSAHGRAAAVIREAYGVTQCDSCGPGSSCYRCLRTYGNQRHHEELDRTAAGDCLQAFAKGKGT